MASYGDFDKANETRDKLNSIESKAFKAGFGTWETVFKEILDLKIKLEIHIQDYGKEKQRDTRLNDLKINLVKIKEPTDLKQIFVDWKKAEEKAENGEYSPFEVEKAHELFACTAFFLIKEMLREENNVELSEFIDSEWNDSLINVIKEELLKLAEEAEDNEKISYLIRTITMENLDNVELWKTLLGNEKIGTITKFVEGLENKSENSETNSSLTESAKKIKGGKKGFWAKLYRRNGKKTTPEEPKTIPEVTPKENLTPEEELRRLEEKAAQEGTDIIFNSKIDVLTGEEIRNTIGTVREGYIYSEYCYANTIRIVINSKKYAEKTDYGNKFSRLEEIYFNKCGQVVRPYYDYDEQWGKSYQYWGNNLKKVTMSDWVVEICKNALRGYPIEEIELGNNLEYIHEFALAETNIKRIKLPDSVKKIYEDAFDGCKELGGIELGEGMPIIEKQNIEAKQVTILIKHEDQIKKIEDALKYQIVNAHTNHKYSNEEINDILNGRKTGFKEALANYDAAESQRGSLPETTIIESGQKDETDEKALTEI